jgi:hypothetical protein
MLKLLITGAALLCAVIPLALLELIVVGWNGWHGQPYEPSIYHYLFAACVWAGGCCLFAAPVAGIIKLTRKGIGRLSAREG